MEKLVFTASLWAPLEGKGWTFLTLPKPVSEKLPSRGKVPVKGTLNGFPFTSTLSPDGEGSHELMVNRTIRDGAGVAVGDLVEVALEVDTAPRVVDPPADLERALANAKPAKALWDVLSPGHRRQYVLWIEEAKRAETRERRVAETVRLLAEGRKRRDG